MSWLYQLLPIVAICLFLIAATLTNLRPMRTWLVPGTVAALFLGWSVYAVAAEGPFGFWPNHTHDAWGNQVWLDLLIAIGIGWALLVPRAKSVGMYPWPWLALIVCSGCIGLAAMTARCLYLENRRCWSFENEHLQ